VRTSLKKVQFTRGRVASRRFSWAAFLPITAHQLPIITHQDQVSRRLGHRTSNGDIELSRSCVRAERLSQIPLAPRTARAVDLVVGERCEGPIFLGADGCRLDRHGAGRIVRRVARRAGITKPVGPHTLRHAFITAAQLTPEYRSATYRKRRRMPTRAPRCDTTERGCLWTGTPPTSSPRSWQGRPAESLRASPTSASPSGRDESLARARTDGAVCAHL